MRIAMSLAGISVQAAETTMASRSAFVWSSEPWVVTLLAAAIIAYGAGLRRMWRRPGAARSLGPAAPAAFAGGMAALVAALLSPIDALGEDLFSVHMVQHLILILIAAPLLVWGRPFLVFVWAMPPGLRKRFGRLLAAGNVPRVIGLVASPAAIWVAFCGSFVVWHLPGLYAWALRHEAAHALEHISFFLSAFAFWSVVIEPSGRRRLDHGASLLYVGTAAILSGLPGALMILTNRPFYSVHSAGVARWGLTLLEDQQLAGLVMWIPAGIIYLAAVAVLFVGWLRHLDQRVSAAQLRGGPLLLLPLLILIAGCSERSQTGTAASFGDPRRGAAEIAAIGCGSCHIIPGITGARGLVGPPLDHMGRRIYVAGLLRNTPENLMAWLENPQRFVPGNAMPDMGLKADQSRDIAAYLYTLN